MLGNECLTGHEVVLQSENESENENESDSEKRGGGNP
jgi:hypothetical protein